MSMNDENSMSQKQLHDNTVALLIAGHDTTSTALQFAMYSLGKFPETQQKMYEEIQSVVGDEDVTYEHLEKLEYTHAFIKETIRMYRGGVGLPRYAAKDTELGGYRIPKGTIVQINSRGIHHNPNIWKSPEVFKPERFMKDTEEKHAMNSFLPFSTGQHICIGHRFTVEEQKIFFVQLLKQFKVDIEPGYEVKYQSDSIGKIDSQFLSVLTLRE